MKTLRLLISIILIFTCSKSYSQNNDTIINHVEYTQSLGQPRILPDIFSTDKNLILIGKHIPINWDVSFVNDTLTFKNTSPIYKLDASAIADTFIKGRTKLKEMPPREPEYARIVFRLEPVWPGQKVEDAQLQNSHTLALIKHLEKKYKISHLIDLINSEEFDIDSPKLKENEKKSILRYLEEKEKLSTELIQVPIYHTSDFSFFLVEIFPPETEHVFYTPPGIIQETDTIINFFNQFAGK